MMFSLLDNLPHGLIVLNSKFEIEFWNDAMIKHTGFSKTEMTAKNYSKLQFYEDQNAVYPLDFKSCFENDGSIQRQVFIKDSQALLKPAFIALSSSEFKNQSYYFLSVQNLEQIIQCDYYLENTKISQDSSCSFHNIIGCHHHMRELFRLIELAADSDVSILISGESGTGKEMIAKTIHSLSKRSSKSMITVNCSALSENLLESELFGHIKGSFTGAIKDKIGKFEAANGSTIFLDEIGEISPMLQVKLLRVLQEHTLERVGDNSVKALDIRVIAATNQLLQEKVQHGTFREDLYYRLNVFPLQTIPLRDRRTDIPFLVTHFIEKYNKRTGKKIVNLSKSAVNILMNYDWPGNVRQLENSIEYAFVIARTNRIESEHLPLEVMRNHEFIRIEPTQKKRRHAISKEDLLSILDTNNNHRGKTAQQLGISKVALWKKMKKYELV